MSKEIDRYSQKKRVSIIRKPFSQGQVNLFHPPKKNPNGHLASATILDKETPVKLPSTEEEELPSPIEETSLTDDKSFDESAECHQKPTTSPRSLEIEDINAIELWEEEISEELPEANREEIIKPRSTTSESKPPRFLNPWRIGAISLIICGNLIAATAIFLHNRQQESLANLGESDRQLYTSGKSDLTAQEFVELDLQSLKNIEPAEVKIAEKTPPQPPENLPLAIPPTSLPQNIILPQANKSSQYYYILSEYTGDRSLEIAKAKVPNVSLINFPQGIFIYLGAFTEKEPASKFLQQLKELGLEGYIYPSR